MWGGVRVLSLALAGVLIDRLSIPTAMFFSAATFYFMATVVPLLRLRPRPPATGQVLRQIVEGVRYVRNHSVFMVIMLLSCCNSVFGMAYIFLMPVFAKEVFHVGPEKIGWLLGVSGIGALVSNIIVGSLKSTHPKGLVILGGSVLYGLALILFSAAAWQGLYGVSMGLLFVVGIATSVYIVSSLSALQQQVPDEFRGRVMGLYGISWSLAPLGMAQGGLVAQYFGAPLAVAIGAVVILLVAALVFVLSSDIRTLRVAVPEQLRAAY